MVVFRIVKALFSLIAVSRTVLGLKCYHCEEVDQDCDYGECNGIDCFTICKLKTSKNIMLNNNTMLKKYSDNPADETTNKGCNAPELPEILICSSAVKSNENAAEARLNKTLPYCEVCHEFDFCNEGISHSYPNNKLSEESTTAWWKDYSNAKVRIKRGKWAERRAERKRNRSSSSSSGKSSGRSSSSGRGSSSSRKSSTRTERRQERKRVRTEKKATRQAARETRKQTRQQDPHFRANLTILL